MPPELLTSATVVFVASFVLVALRSSQQQDGRGLKIDIHEGEEVLDQLEISGRFSRSQLVLTSHRLISRRVRWRTARGSHSELPLEKVGWAQLVHMMNPGALLAGVLLFAAAAPLGVLLVLYALVATQMFLVVLGGGWLMGFSSVGDVRVAHHATLFLRRLSRARAQVSGHPVSDSALTVPEPAVFTRSIPQACWLGVLGMMLLAAAARTLSDGVALDSAPVLALLSAIPAAVGARSGARSGFWCGFFGVYGVLSVLFPSALAPELAIGAAAPGTAWLCAALSAGTIGALASRGPAAAAAAALLWVPTAIAAGASGTWTLAFAATVLTAAGAIAIAIAAAASPPAAEPARAEEEEAAA